MSKSGIYEKMARRAIPPERPLSLALALRIGEDLTHRAVGDVIPFQEYGDHAVSSIWDVHSVFEPGVKSVFIRPGTREVVPSDAMPTKVEMAFHVHAHPQNVPSLRPLTAEDAHRVQDFLSLAADQRTDIADLRVLTPSHDPAEAVAWILPALQRIGAKVEYGSVHFEPRPLAEVSLTIENLGGNCPVQAEGVLADTRFYYRARGTHQALETETGFEFREPVIGNEFVAGWISDEAARRFIMRAAQAYARFANLNDRKFH